ncbi:Stp1/IreP family PP2C-type Ser/Thr phosphatase [Streptococcus ruminantium]|uniref:Stp1/IreP family PP2C-type Ser/Thr phosphatase n=1 Tax=Streptococcus ruminantium TaxID=1917441 RepID=A0ABU1B3Y2_9STRE|nr:Stp1/IreP family PP2C-type Ser/Thr phosphatase [Streptococcus ruminantium]MDQ8760087.1 Stp1/IreP family PP2C-type Ser/Thr phosphatase [Streptococcus ruminantium]MDQ8764319.1 Stp1/IreP family PP2C-type Ser/Thr phosphatase [Streptococcus ruminantium]MDQ8766720.1 Stp1/IreP family PP2C-type Ser/Thr phosphatase [Streptococcus ruminantium]MDQ8769339.1 Stp1/IreP family PP2C-type Ser/Thr phosphatase [Streptococcus ruminantium]MDQ8775338.1 Stp1/IreP family PP2C-type Ser/Thr phosphatase [Streptococcu
MEIALLTDVGQKRSNNQDYISRYKNRAGIDLVVLADGLGGHRAGHIASEMAATDMGAAWVDTQLVTLSDVREWLITIIDEENQKIHSLGLTDEYKGMGTTLEAVVVIDNQMIYAHIGDSRVGLIRDGEYTCLTNDHSLVGALVRAGQLTEEEAQRHPQKNFVTQSIGQAEPIEPDIALRTLEVGDYVLINSDGLTNMVSIEDIRDIILSEVSLESKAETLVRFANNAGGLDNITVGLLHITEEAR